MSYKAILYDKTGGFPFDQQTLEFMQDAYTKVATGLGLIYGNNIILSGVEDQGANYSDGWVAVGGEVLPFVGGLKASKIVVEETTEAVTFEDTNEHAVEVTRVAKSSNVNGVDFTTFKRIGQAIRDVAIAPGTITHLKTDAIETHFDLNTGLGISDQWKGWQIDPDAKGRVIMGWDGDIVEYDNADGSKNGGLKEVILTANQSGLRGHGHNVNDPGHSHTYEGFKNVQDGFGESVKSRQNVPEDYDGDYGGEPSLTGLTVVNAPPSNALEAHENRPPYVVYLTVVKL
jgi:hypothetical protein